MVFKNMSSEPIKYKKYTVKSESNSYYRLDCEVTELNKNFLNNKFWSQVPLRKQSRIPYSE